MNVVFFALVLLAVASAAWLDVGALLGDSRDSAEIGSTEGC